MPVDFGKVSINALYSEDATHANPKLRFAPAPYTLSPVQCATGIASVTSSGRYLSNSLDTSGLLVVKHPGTIPVELTWTSLEATLVLTSGQTLTFNNSAKTITLSGSALPSLTASINSGSYVSITGTGLATANTGFKLVSQISSTVITVPGSYTLADEGVTTCTIKVLRSNFTLLPAGGVTIIPDAMYIYPITATSTGGDTEVETMTMVP